MVTVACIPAYNEERNIASVVIGAQKHAETVIVCDDGSKDMTAVIAERLGAKVIRHERNMGKGEALRSLFLASRGLNADVTVTLDGDGQHNPEEIPRLVQAVSSESADVVIGSRFLDGENEIPSHRRVGNKVLSKMTVQGVADTQSGFRAYSKKAINMLLPAEMGMGADSEILIDAANKGLKVVEVPASVRYGIGKTSKHNPVYHTLDVLTSLLKLVLIRHPLISFGIPGLGLILGGLYFAFRTLTLFSDTGVTTNLTLTYSLIAFAITLFGVLTIFTGVILFTISTIVRKERS